VVVHALDSLGFEFCPDQRRQQQRREDRYDGDDYQQFDQGETWGGRPAPASFGPSEETEVVHFESLQGNAASGSNRSLS
jgi:hypothetical protein